MIAEKIEHLMWQEIDGTINPRGRARLEAHLAGDPEAATHYRELLTLTQLLGGVEDVEPPPALREGIEKGIAHVPLPGEPKSSRVPRMSMRFRGIARYTAAAAAGFLVGLAGYQLVTYRPGLNGSLDISAIRGTMKTIDPSSAGQGLEIKVAGVEGVIHHIDLRHQRATISTIEITSEERIELLVTYHGEVAHVGALQEEGGPTNKITVEHQTIRISNAGTGRYSLWFETGDASASPISVRITAGGAVVLEDSLHPAQIK